MDLSVVVPLLNEEECVRELHRRISEALRPTGMAFEIIFVDDGSTDRTFPILKEIKAADDSVKVVKLRRNFGQTPAMQAGFERARGRVVASMDGDLQNDPGDIPRLIAKLEEGYELVCGWRKDRQDKLIVRKVPSMLANRLITRVTGIRIHDTGCALKVYKRSALEKTKLYSDMHRFIPAIMSMSGVRYTELPVTHHARKFGTSKYGLSRIWKVFLDILSIKMLISFSARPALWFGLLSLPFFAAGAVFGGLSLVPEDEPSIVFPSAALILLGLASSMLLLGLLGEIIRRASFVREIDAIDLSTIVEWTPSAGPSGAAQPEGGRA